MDIKDDTTKLHQIAVAKRLNVEKARVALDELTDLRTEAETFLDLDVYTALDNVNQSLESLDALVHAGLALHPEQMLVFIAMVSDIIDLLPAEEAIRAFVETYDEAENAILDAEEHKESPREFDTETKQETRERVQEQLTELADALSSLTPVETPEETK